MADDVCFALLRNTIYQILHSAGFESSHGEPANVLADIFGQYIQLLASSATTYAQLAGRTVASPWDIADGLVDVQVTLDQLEDWLDSEQGQFLAPAWSTKADPNAVLKDVVTKGQVHHEVSQMLYQYCVSDQRYYQSNSDKLEHTNGDDVNGIPSSLVDCSQHTKPFPDYVPLHLPSFPSPDSDDTANQVNDAHQSNRKGDQTTMQREYTATTMLSSLLPGTDHNKLPSSSTSAASKKAKDNPFIHVVPFDDSSLACGNSLSLALSSSTYTKPSSSSQQQQRDLEERNELELAKKQRRAEINGTMEATINTMMEQYRQQQKQLGMDGNQRMFQHITQNEAAPGKTSLGTRDSILDEMVHRLAPPVALARLSSPNLLLDTAIPPASPLETPTTTGKDTPNDEKDTTHRSAEPSSPPALKHIAPSSPSSVKKAIPPPKLAMNELAPPQSTPSTSTESTASPYHPGSSSITAYQKAAFGSPPIPTFSQTPVKKPMSIAMLSARGSTNSIKKDKNGLPVKNSDEARNGTGLPKKKKKSKPSMEVDNTTKSTPQKPSKSQPPPTSTMSKQHHQQQVTSTTNHLPPTTTRPEPAPTVLKKRKKIKDDNSGLRRQRITPDTPPKVRFKEQVDISNSADESHYWSTPSPSLQQPTQTILSTKPTIATSASTSHSHMTGPTVSSPVPIPSTVPTSTATNPSSSYTQSLDHTKKRKKKKPEDQHIRPFHPSTAMAPNKINVPTITNTTNNKNINNSNNMLTSSRAPSITAPTKLVSSSPASFHHAKKQQAAPKPASYSSSSSSISAPTLARTTTASTSTAPIMLLPTPATNMYYDAAETVQCICENPTVDYGSFMISCDRCLVWFHGSCVRIAEHDQVDYWICTRCK